MKKVWKSFTLNISLIIVLFILGIYVGLLIRNEHLIREELRTRARAHFDTILLFRGWNSNYGGVFIEKTVGVVSNPYLQNPDIHTIDGKIYTKKNPFLMVREASKAAEKK